jgi:hypothetical protein
MISQDNLVRFLLSVHLMLDPALRRRGNAFRHTLNDAIPCLAASDYRGPEECVLDRTTASV